jgi:hypothetical protein
LNVTAAPLPERCVCVLVHIAAAVRMYSTLCLAGSSLWLSLVFPC